ncbi:MAG: hypothetical protein IIY96_05825 [Lachnospiraceae bacterium]|nr:hypothetical protein [Lachnospiraceae bacterium]
MKYYLIDYENVKTEGLLGIEELLSTDTVHIFYSDNADKLTFDVLRMIMCSKAKILYQKVGVGHKNALDFQLASYLGYLIRDNADRPYEYYIVSKDNGYEALAAFWKEHDAMVRVISGISTQMQEEMEKALKEKVESALTKNALGNADDAAAVTKIIMSYKTKQGINNALQKRFPERVKDIYRTIKPLITDKKGK